jgi:hypothetical protein
MVADVNGRSGERRAVELAASLRDSAVSVLSLMRKQDRVNYPALLQTLQERFEPANLLQMHQATLKSRSCQGEALTALGADIKRLVRQAYPDAEGTIFNQLALVSFLDALKDADMEWAVRQGQATTVDTAVTLAMQYEAFRRVQALESKKIFAVNAPATGGDCDQPRDRRQCYYCKEQGHLCQTCPKTARDRAAAKDDPNRGNGTGSGQG